MGNRKLSFDEYYQLLINYYNTHNNSIEMKQSFKTFNGIEEDSNGYRLGVWLGKIRLSDNLDDDKRQKLIKLGLKFGKKHNRVKLSWDDWYNLAYMYYQENGNLNMPSTYITSTGYKLGMWISNQRKRQDNLTTLEYNKLINIGMNFESSKSDLEWNNNFYMIKDYYDKYKDLFNISNELKEWLVRQKYNYKNLSNYKKEKLSLIGIDDNSRIAYLKWDDVYLYAIDYYNTYGNLKISPDYITSDGYKLGKWIKAQRARYKILSIDKINKLNNIGMIWSIRTDKKELINLLQENNIDIKINKDILYKSYNEVYVKICFLKDLRKKLTNSKGILNEIFYMSNKVLYERYNINLEYLLTTYLEYKRKIR